jgi:hypothetical protein
LAALLLVMSDFLDPGRGPDQRGDFRVSPTFFLALVVGGFLVGTLGHVIRSRALVVIGIGMIFLATIFIPIALGVSR